MNLDSNKNYLITAKSMHNPTLGPMGAMELVKHHALEVQEVDSKNNVVGHPVYAGYYPKAILDDIKAHQTGHNGKFKLTNPNLVDMINPFGSVGHWTTPDPIVESELSNGKQSMRSIGESKIVSGYKFNKLVGNHVNIPGEKKYSATSGLLKTGLQKTLGHNVTNMLSGNMGNCQSEVAAVMKVLEGGRKRRTKKKRKRRIRKKRKKRTRKRRTRKKRKY